MKKLTTLAALALSLVVTGATVAAAAPAQPTGQTTLSYTVNEYRLTDDVRAARKACYYAEYPALPAEPFNYERWYYSLSSAEHAAWKATFDGCVTSVKAEHRLARTCVVTYLYPANRVVSRECEQR